MSARAHSNLCQVFPIASIPFGLAFAFLLLANFVLGIALIFIFVSGYAAVVLWLPVHCTTRGCDGHLRRELTRLSFLRSILSYRCEDCGQACDYQIYFLGFPI